MDALRKAEVGDFVMVKPNSRERHYGIVREVLPRAYVIEYTHTDGTPFKKPKRYLYPIGGPSAPVVVGSARHGHPRMSPCACRGTMAAARRRWRR